jgi:hypothetical protein
VADAWLVYEERVEGVPTYPSPVATKDGRIYFAGSGTSCVIKEGARLEVLARNVLEGERRGEGGSSGPFLAVAAGRILLRSPRALYCIARK